MQAPPGRDRESRGKSRVIGALAPERQHFLVEDACRNARLVFRKRAEDVQRGVYARLIVQLATERDALAE